MNNLSALAEARSRIEIAAEDGHTPDLDREMHRRLVAALDRHMEQGDLSLRIEAMLMRSDLCRAEEFGALLPRMLRLAAIGLGSSEPGLAVDVLKALRTVLLRTTGITVTSELCDEIDIIAERIAMWDAPAHRRILGEYNLLESYRRTGTSILRHLVTWLDAQGNTEHAARLIFEHVRSERDDPDTHDPEFIEWMNDLDVPGHDAQESILSVLTTMTINLPATSPKSRLQELHSRIVLGHLRRHEILGAKNRASQLCGSRARAEHYTRILDVCIGGKEPGPGHCEIEDQLEEIEAMAKQARTNLLDSREHRIGSEYCAAFALAHVYTRGMNPPWTHTIPKVWYAGHQASIWTLVMRRYRPEQSAFALIREAGRWLLEEHLPARAMTRLDPTTVCIVSEVTRIAGHMMKDSDCPDIGEWVDEFVDAVSRTDFGSCDAMEILYRCERLRDLPDTIRKEGGGIMGGMHTDDGNNGSPNDAQPGDHPAS